MPILSISQSKIDALESLTNESYEALKKVLESRDNSDAVNAVEHYHSLFDLLTVMTDYTIWGKFGREEENGKLLSRYILQAFIGESTASSLQDETNPDKVNHDKDSDFEEFYTKERLIDTISDNKNTFGYIYIMSNHLAILGKFNDLLLVMDCVRENYLKPNASK